MANNLSTQKGLPDLDPDLYQGFPGYLYVGSNQRPAAQDAFAIATASTIVPINGKIVVVGIGHSNWSQCLSGIGGPSGLQEPWTLTGPGQGLISALAQDSTIRPDFTLIDGASFGAGADYWAGVVSGYNPWTGRTPTGQPNLQSRLQMAGLSMSQVQVLFLKTTKAYPPLPSVFPAYAQTVQVWIEQIFRNALIYCPACKLIVVFPPDHTWSAGPPPGSANSAPTLNPEPRPFEDGFAAKWAILQQYSGDPSLNYDPALGSVFAPLAFWGAYTWGNDTGDPDINVRGPGQPWNYNTHHQDETHRTPDGVTALVNQIVSGLKADLAVRPWLLTNP